LADTDNPRPTPYQDLNAVLRALIDGVRDVLGNSFVGAYLQGSFAVGGFDPHSDVDWVIVTETELSGEHVQALQHLHGRIYELDSAWAQHLEGSYFPRDILRDCARCGAPLWYLDNGSRALIQATHCNTAVVRWVVRERGVMLAGPDPAALVDPIPVDTLREEILAVMLDWGRQILADPDRIGNRFYQSFAVLSYCRMLHDLQAGSVGSKRTGAEWAKAALDLDPEWPGLIDRAWAGRPVPEVSVRTPADPADLQRTLAFVRFMMQAGERYATTLKNDERQSP
jgi:hypothetical protein